MDTKHYEKLLAMVMDKLNQTQIEKDWLKIENERLKEQINKTKEIGG